MLLPHRTNESFEGSIGVLAVAKARSIPLDAAMSSSCARLSLDITRVGLDSNGPSVEACTDHMLSPHTCIDSKAGSEANQHNVGLMHHRLHRQLRKGLSLAEELQHFAGRARSMTSAMRRRSLAALLAALPARQHQLFQQGPSGQLPAFLPKVEEATWRLV